MHLTVYCLVTVFLVCIVQGVRDSAKAAFQDMNLAPDISFRIQIVPDTQIIQGCLARCMSRQECMSVVYGNHTCYLYSTTHGIHVLNTGDKMVAKASASVVQG
jgi:hypothetical protein